MKIHRLKKSHKVLSFYALNFNYHEPFQILIDGTFCLAALQNKINIDEQLKKYLQSELKFLTTQCIILESESLGPKLIGATQIVKKYHVHKCGHEGNPIPASKCILSIVRQSKYIIASQDRDLQHKLRLITGQAILYLHRATPVLEQPSKITKKAITTKQKRLMLSNETEKKIQKFKNIEGVPEKNLKFKNVKKRKPKNPNPLSCKKKNINNKVERKL